MFDHPIPAALSYRLAPPDRTGLLLGLHGPQLAVLAAGLLVGVGLMLTVNAVVGVAAVATIAAVGLLRLDGIPAVMLWRDGRRWLLARITRDYVWFAPVPTFGPEIVTPGFLAGQQILAVDAADFGYARSIGEIAVVHDHESGTFAASFRAAGTGLALLEPDARDQQLAGWGSALDAFVRERSPVVAIRWTETAAPAGTDASLEHLQRHRADEPVADAERTYRGLLAQAGPVAVRHDITLTVTVAADKVRVGRRYANDRTRVALDTLLTETRLFADRLAPAGLHVTAPLDAATLTRTLRHRLDPTCRLRLERLERAQREPGHPNQDTPPDAAPLILATEPAWTQLVVDESWHRTFLVQNWPRLDVPANWLEPLLMWNGAIRSVTVIASPIARSTSQRDITRHAAKLDGDVHERSRRGFRVGAGIHHAAAAVQQREQELITGYGELAYTGILTVTAPSLDDLDAAADQLTMTAASIGIEARPLHGRHDTAFAVTLPLARFIA